MTIDFCKLLNSKFQLMSSQLIKNSFYLAGLINILGTLTFSKFFTNNTLIEIDPIVMSEFGLIMIIVWGLAFIAIANHYKKNRWIVGVFCLEKLAYVIAWIFWLFGTEYTLINLFEKDVFTGLFYSSYGINDLFFLTFFTYVFFKKY